MRPYPSLPTSVLYIVAWYGCFFGSVDVDVLSTALLSTDVLSLSTTVLTFVYCTTVLTVVQSSQ
jgi:hypothetical protein